MAPAVGVTHLSARRAQLAGPSGVRGLTQNPRTLAIALFASLGGFVYGCKFMRLNRQSCWADEVIRQPGNV